MAAGKRIGAVDWSVVLSVIAIVVAIGSPFVTYNWLQNDLRLRQIKATALRVELKGASSVAMDGKTEDVTRTDDIRVTNGAALPIGGVELILKHDTNEKFFDGAVVTVDPPLRIKKSLVEGVLTIGFESPLAPEQSIEVLITRNKNEKDAIAKIENYDGVRVWIRSEASATALIPLGHQHN